MHMHVLHGGARSCEHHDYHGVRAGETVAVELATVEWVFWFDHHRLLKPLGYTPPTEIEVNYYMQLSSQAIPG